MLKSWCSATPFLVFREGQFLSKMFAKWIVNSMLIYVGVISSTSTRSYLYFFLFFFNFLDINFSQEYSVGCAWISIKRIHKKVLGRDVRIGIFPIPIASRTGRNSGFSSKIGRIPTRSGWLDSPLACPLFHCLGPQYGGRDVTWKRPMHLDTSWHHLATLLDFHTTISLHDDDITLYIIYISLYAVLVVLVFYDVTT